MRLAFALAVLPLPLAAHPGHLAEVGSHDHWVAGAAIGIAAAIGIWRFAKGRRGRRAEAAGRPRPESDAGSGAEARG